MSMEIQDYITNRVVELRESKNTILKEMNDIIRTENNVKVLETKIQFFTITGALAELEELQRTFS